MDAAKPTPLVTPDRAGLRSFGLVTGAAFVVVFGLALPWIFGLPWPRWPWALAALLAVPALLAPMLLGPVWRVWMRMATWLGHINSIVLLSVVFFTVFTPLGWVRRRMGADPMRRRTPPTGSLLEPAAERPPKSLERPY